MSAVTAVTIYDAAVIMLRTHGAHAGPHAITPRACVDTPEKSSYRTKKVQKQLP